MKRRNQILWSRICRSIADAARHLAIRNKRFQPCRAAVAPLPVRHIRKHVATVCLIAGVSFGACPFGWSQCSAPPSIAPKLKNNPTANTYTELGKWFATRRQFGCAADAFRKASAMQPNSARIAYLLGLSLYSNGHPAQALRPLKRSVRLNPRALKAHLLLGSALDRTRHRLEAETQWRLALAIHPASTIARNSLARDLLADKDYSAVIALLEPLASNGSLSAPLTIDLSVAYTKSGLVKNAYQLLDTARQKHPGSVALAEAMCSVLVLQNQDKKAEKILSATLKQHPSVLSLNILYLRTLVLAHDPRADKLAKRLLQAHPNQWQLLYLMGVVNRWNGDFAKAREHLLKSIQLHPDYADSHYHLGLNLASQNDDAGALKEFQRAVELGYHAPRVHYELGRMLHATGKPQEARKQFLLYQKALKGRSALTKAASEAKQGDTDEAEGKSHAAVANYRTAVQAAPTQPIFQYKLALALEKVGNRAGERKALDQAVRLNPHLALAQNQLGYLDFSEGHTASAIQRFKLAVKVNPGYAKAWMNLAAALCLAEKLPQASQALHHVLALEPHNHPAEELLQRVRAAQTHR